MNIDVSDEMIEKVIEQQVSKRIDQYFKSVKENQPLYMENLVARCVRSEICLEDIHKIVDAKCEELSQDDIANRISENLSRRIAKSFYNDCEW